MSRKNRLMLSKKKVCGHGERSLVIATQKRKKQGETRAGITPGFFIVHTGSKAWVIGEACLPRSECYGTFEAEDFCLTTWSGSQVKMMLPKGRK